MKITILTENTEGIQGTRAEHGLSVYAETKKHILLSDTGASDALIENAKVMGIDLRKVDTLVLSHGHYDHCGGVIPFSEINNIADIYIREGSDGPFYDSAGKYIGIDKRIMNLPNLHKVKKDEQIDVAFIPVNQPYTMTVEQAIRAAWMIQPKVLIPYHFGQTDIKPIKERLDAAKSGIEVWLREMQ